MTCPTLTPGRTRHRSWQRPLLLLLAVTCAEAAGADPVLDQLEAARRAYQEGEPRVAVQALNFAIAQIEEQQTERQLSLFPEPLPGWRADDATIEAAGIAAMLAGKVLSRTYHHEDGGARIDIRFSANAPFLMQMPMLLQADPATSLYTYGKYRGMLKQDPNDGLDLSLMVDNNVLLQLSGSGGADQADLEAYLEAIDIPAMQKALSE